MLSWMREKAPFIMAVAILAFIGTTIYFSITTGAVTGGDKVGTIGKETIRIAEFDKRLRDVGNRIQDDEQQKSLAKNVWEMVVNERAFLASIKEMQLNGTEQEVYDYIYNNPHPMFNSEFTNPQTGQFDTAAYKAKIVDPAYQEREDVKQALKTLEQITKEQFVPGSKLNFLLTTGKNPSKSEIEVEYKRRNEKVVFEYLTASKDSIALDSNAVTTAKLEKYYNDNKEKFTGGERAAIEFVKIELKPGPADEQVIIKELLEVKDNVLKAAAGPERDTTFMDEVNFESDNEQSKKYGGMFGTITKGATRFPHVENAVLALNKGDVSHPIKIDNDYHIFYVTAKSDSTATVSHIMKNITLSYESRNKAREMVNTMVKAAELTPLSELAAKNENAVCDTSNFFKKGEYPADFPYFGEIGRLAFDEEENRVGEYENNEVYYVVKRFKKVNDGTLPLVDIEGVVRKAVEEELKAEKAKAAIADALAKVTDSLTLETIAKENAALSYAKTDTVARVDLMRTLNGLKIVSTAFAAKENEFSTPLEIEGGFVTVKPLYKSLIDTVPATAYTDKEMIGQMKAAATQQANDEWLEAYKKKVGVEENLTKFYF